ncbi:hypothetical protein TVAG_225320 [Trichomonas vaginalis G3]|uniref:VASt domain-containing protein n=1 Tax=Trichomonas vaginalis (strain ATCC PRA-98 / G3) TaxID=412133 RepID=A2DNR1_TRIV3|nr:VAD1-like protein [Trichomonas vaginalis G3]EAY17906.1 hypothetical protein TVAG_225320 [Trichomonas vaginalis G3]KAI5527069.1 VAD1-like protein [Trichomonas vaginalis G3]|eukprot:XP_001578892.1 hypothetical protein [Trichomonas vaginalis G3]
MADSEKLTGYSCFLVKKVSHHGALILYKTKVQFAYSGEERKIDIKLQDIKAVNVEKHLVGAVSNLELQLEDQSYLFSGIHEAEQVKNYISLLQAQIQKPTYTFGLTNEAPKSEEIKWQPLANPTILVNSTIPAPLAKVREIVEGPDLFSELCIASGNEEVKVSDFEQQNEYKERNMDYMKLVVVPVIGKSLIHVIEYQRVFELEGGFGIHIISDLGKTPYADCFDPFVQLYFADKGDSTEMTVSMEIVWSSEPFVKSIIENQTTSAIKALYVQFNKDLNKQLGADVAENPADEEDANAGESKLAKVKIIYKFVIILLSIILLLLFVNRCWPDNGIKLSKALFAKLLAFVIFILVLLLM